MRPFLGLVLVLAVACAEAHSRDPDAGMSGSGGGGSGGTAGSGGTSGSGGSGGTSGSGGSGGVSGSGGSGGVSEAECQSADDCVLVNDCCNCEAIPNGQEPPPACERLCIINSCEALGVDAVMCLAGHCVLDVNCNHNDAECDAIPPACPDGQVASVQNGCYGGCVDAVDCREVTSCDDCDNNATCVTYWTSGGRLHQCVELPNECGGTPSCECMGESVCVPPFNCGDENLGLSCSCPNCG